MTLRQTASIAAATIAFISACGSTHAQSPAPAATPLHADTVSSVTVYTVGNDPAMHRLTADACKKYGFSSAIQDAAVIQELLMEVRQGSRAEVAPAPAVNAHFHLEINSKTEDYDIGPDGMVWSGGHCYKLSKSDHAALTKLIRSEFFPSEFWRAHVKSPIAAGNWSNTSTVFQPDLGMLHATAINLTFVVDETGHVQAVNLDQSSGDLGFDDFVCEETKNTRYIPGTQDGAPKWFILKNTFTISQR